MMKNLSIIFLLLSLSLTSIGQEKSSMYSDFHDLRYNTALLSDWKSDNSNRDMHVLSKIVLKDARMKSEWNISLTYIDLDGMTVEKPFVSTEGFKNYVITRSKDYDDYFNLDEGKKVVKNHEFIYQKSKSGQIWKLDYFILLGRDAYHISYTSDSPFGLDSSGPFDKEKKTFNAFMEGLLFPGEEIPRNFASASATSKFNPKRVDRQQSGGGSLKSAKIGKKLMIKVENNIPAQEGVKWRLTGRAYVGEMEMTDNPEESGFVVIKIKVDQGGIVTEAKSTPYTNTKNEQLIELASKAAMTCRFSEDASAPPSQAGFLTFDFR